MINNTVNVLLLGASGQVGQAILKKAKLEKTLNITKGTHSPHKEGLFIDYASLVSKKDWLPILKAGRFSVVINCIGIWSGSATRFDIIQYLVPLALMQACEELNIHLVHVSALGFKENTNLPYVDTKIKADLALKDFKNKITLIKPSLIYGNSGGSSNFFKLMASFPIILDFGFGKNLQPVHEADVAYAIIDSIYNQTEQYKEVECVGTHSISAPEYLSYLRKGLGYTSAPIVKIPSALGSLIFKTGSFLGLHFICKQSWTLLKQGTKSEFNNPAATPYTEFTTKEDAPAVYLTQLYLLARFAMVIIWGWTAITTWWFWSHADTLNWLGQLSPHFSDKKLLALSCLFDATMAILTIYKPSKLLWFTQLATTAFYSVCLYLFLPWTIFHPFGPLSKNLAIFAVLGYLILFEKIGPKGDKL